MQKKTFRWNWGLKTWMGPLEGYRLGRCGVCGKEEVFFRGKGYCRNCRQARYKAQRALRGPAHNEVHKAIEEGRLPRLDGSIACLDCGKPAQVYEHREYAKPLAVDPTCKSCNVRRGPAVDMAHLWLPRRSKPISRP